MKRIQKYLQNIVQFIQKGIINLIYSLILGCKQDYRSCGNQLQMCCFDIGEKPIMSEYECKNIYKICQKWICFKEKSANTEIKKNP